MDTIKDVNEATPKAVFGRSPYRQVSLCNNNITQKPNILKMSDFDHVFKVFNDFKRLQPHSKVKRTNTPNQPPSPGASEKYLSSLSGSPSRSSASGN